MGFFRLAVVAVTTLALGTSTIARADTVVVFGDDLAALTSANFTEATAGDRERPAFTGSRASLDTNVVVELVRDKLKEAGVKAASRALKKLLKKELRPWMRDLFVHVIDIAANRKRTAKVAGEGFVRMGARIVFSEAVVRTRFRGNTDVVAAASEVGLELKSSDTGDVRGMLIDWLYWRLSRHESFAGEVEQPACSGKTAGAELCTQLAALATEELRVAKVDELTGIAQVIAAVDLVRRLHDRLEGKPLSLRRVIAQILAVPPDVTAAALGVDVTTVDAVIAAATTVEDAYEAVRLRSTSVASAVHEVDAAFTAYLVDPASIEGLRQSLGKLKNLLNAELIAGKDLVRTIRDLTGAPGLRKAFAPIEAALVDLATVDLQARPAAIVALLNRHSPAAIVEKLSKIELGALREAVRLVRADIDAVRAQTGALGDVTVIGAVKLARDFARLAEHLLMFADIAARLEIVPRTLVDELDTVRRGAQTVAGWCELLGELGSADGAGKLHAVVTLIRSVAGKDAMPVIDILEPVLAELADGGLTPAHIFATFSRLPPHDLLRALQLPATEAAACGGDTPASCWGVRLVLMAQDAVTLDGTTLHVETEKVVDDLAAIVGSRRAQRGKPYLHLAVGTGMLVNPNYKASDEIHPLIAEQIGVGFKICGGDVAFRLAAYGSGILYRFVLDSEESDGVMFGAAAILDVFGDVELHAGPAVLLKAGEGGLDVRDAADIVWTAGIQVPLEDYLAKLSE